MTSVHAYQIYYDEGTRASLDRGFLPLDNLANERPDWREYWPIRRFFQRHAGELDEAALYGFLSPKFGAKTGLKATDVHAFSAQATERADVVIFSPAWDMGALFWNVFDQATCFSPEFAEVSQQFMRGIDTRPVADVATDSRNTVFCNYFLAKPRFWRRWLEVMGLMFDMAERENDRIGRGLRQGVAYAPHAPRVELKVFLAERVASWLLATSNEFAPATFKPFDMPPSDTVFSLFAAEAVAADALKIAYARTGAGVYRTAY